MLMNHHAGFDFIKKVIAMNFRINMVTPLNKGRHILIQCINKSNDCIVYFYCLFKHTTFHSFNFEFKAFVENNVEFEGHGESINVEFLDYARKREATILYIYPDERVYCIESNLIYNFCNKFSLIRTQKRDNEYLVAFSNGVKEVVNEKEYVFPIKLFTRFY